MRPQAPPAGLRSRSAAAAVIGGLLHTASFAPTEAWPLQIAAMALLAAAARGQPPRGAAWAGWWFGFAWLTSGLWWLFISMHRYGGMPAPLAALAVVLLAALLALYLAAAMAAWAWRGGGIAAYAGAWLLAELARGLLLTGFPWISGGYAHTTGPLAAWAPWVGVYGIGALAALAGAALAEALRRRRLRMLALPALLLALPQVLPGAFTRPAGELTVTLLQPNVDQAQKFEASRIERALRWHVDELARARGQLVVTPESSIPVPAFSLAPEAQQALRAPFATGDRVALLGIFLGDDRVGYTNSLAVLSAGSALGDAGLQHYGKRHLLPFGEFIPTGFHAFVALMNIPIGDQEAGREDTLVTVGGQRVRPLICYEDLFGEEMAASVVREGGATLFANATNLAWFGDRMVQDQHLQFSRMRALEFQRPMVRATNTGATAVVDHAGRVTARLPAEVEDVLETSVQGREGLTPYARWVAAWGLAPLLLAALLMLGVRRAP